MELAKAEAGEETNARVEHNISGDLEVQENQGACSLHGAQDGRWRVVVCRGRQNLEVWSAL